MNDLRKEFDDQLVEIAWSLWRELGVASSLRFHENCLISPEELIILTALASKYDPRLKDEALDWCSRYHEHISVSRLRTFLKELDSDTAHSFGEFASALNSISSASWPYAAETIPSKVKVSGKSILPSLESPTLLMLRLRNLFGLGAKADILTTLLTRNETSFSASDLVEIGYSKKSLMTALDQLAASGMLTVKKIKNKNAYELRRPKELRLVTGKLPKTAPRWNKIVQVAIEIRRVISEIQNSSDTTKSVIFRNCLINIESLLPAFISPILNSPADFKRDWKAVMEFFKAFGKGNFFMQFEIYDEFEALINQLLRDFFPMQNYLEELEKIVSLTEHHNPAYAKVYKECYQLFLSLIANLEITLKQFLDFPFHKIMDEPLADISHQFSKEKLPHLLETMQQIKPIDCILNAQSALRQYRQFIPELNILQQLAYSFRKRLKELYFIKTDVHLLLFPDSSKKSLVLELLDTESSS